MTILLIALARSVLAAVCGLIAWAMLNRRSAALRHTVLAASIVASTIVVPLSFLLPQWGLVQPVARNIQLGIPDSTPRADVATTTSSADEPGKRTRTPALGSVIGGVWMAGSLAGLCLLAVRMRRLSRLTSSAEAIVEGPWRELANEIADRYGITKAIEVRRTGTPDVIATWGMGRPRVLIPSDADAWTESWIRVVLCHELAHVRRRDWTLQICAETARAVLWPNPALWSLCSKMRRESECACDDMVVRAGISTDTYVNHLVDIARACRGGASPLPALSIAGASTLERRITMLLKTERDRRLPPWWAVAVLFIGMAVFGGALASVRIFAQAGTGRLTGHVYDTSGAVLPGVEVVLEDAQQGKWPTVTDSSGQFEFTPVGAGRYTLRATLRGFRSLSDQFELKSARDWDRLVTLQVGELEETITVTAQRPAPKPATSTTAAPQPVRVGGNIKAPVKIGNVRPVYPASMSEAGLEGTVPIDALIAIDGTVASVRVLSAQVHPEFARAAETAVRQWRFSQTLLNGVPVEVRMTVSVHFGLTE